MESELQERRCGRCCNQFVICRSCDRGHRYCSAPCASAARRESVRRAQRRYRFSPLVREDRRDKERARRARLRERVGDQSSEKLTDGAQLVVEAEASDELHETAAAVVESRRTDAISFDGEAAGPAAESDAAPTPV